ncbi:MAG: NAD(FAD)-utilizing dehydrogenase [Anaerovorax sp.]
MYRIHEIKLDIGESLEKLPEKIKRKIGMPDLEILQYEIVKESIDARDKGDIKKVYSIDFSVNGGALDPLKLEKAPDRTYHFPQTGVQEAAHRPVIVGFGPCGMFAGLLLAQMGYRPLILEQGKKVEERIKDVERFWKEGVLDEQSNVQFGEGGAGTFSDGKLTTQIKDPRIRKILVELVHAGCDSKILYKQKPHIGTDVLRDVVVHMRNRIIEMGGEIRFQHKLTGISFGQEGQLTGIIVNETEKIDTHDLILAIGHSARDTFRGLNQAGVAMEQKPFSMGVRIEHPQSLVNEGQFGKRWAELDLEQADYKLSYRCKNTRGVYTFCMCPGGHVVAAASSKGQLVTNGMSYKDRSAKNANSGLLVDVRTEDFESDDPLAGIAFQEKYEKLAFEAGGGTYAAPVERVGQFMGNWETYSKAKRNELGALVKPSYVPGVAWTPLKNCLPDFVVESLREAIPNLGRKLKGFDHPGAVLTGVETRSSSPVRILRDENLESNIKGIYPAGEGAGYAGGIVSAAVDGLKIAEIIGKKYKPYEKKEAQSGEETE